MRLLVLYRELAEYMVHCINETQGVVDITVVHYPIHPEAPFEFYWNPSVTHFEKNQTSLKSIDLTSYHAILVSGWADEEYLRIIKKFNGIKILMFDTPWENTLRQQLGRIYFKLKLKKHFNFAFVPGNSQELFAKKIGFSMSCIRTGLYTASDEIETEKKNNHLTKALWCVCRYVPQKNLHFLWSCFLKSKGPELGWKLHCAGTGDGWNERNLNEHIIHHGFLQPKQLNNALNDASAFILPSTYEPWGVVVHECAKKSLPLLLSNAVHSHKHFLSESRNGFTFNPNNENELIQALNKLFEMPESEILKMGKLSKTLSQEISVKNWTQNLMYFLTSRHVRN